MVVQKYKLSSFCHTKQLLGKDDDYPEPFLFREKLHVFDENGKRIGRFSLNVDEIENDRGAKMFCAHISNRAYINGKLSETIVTSTITQKLKTLEEIRYEATETSSSEKHERTLFLLRERTKYFLKVSTNICGLKSEKQVTIPFVEALGLIGEGANAVLLRKLARTGHEGILSLTTVLSNGKRCKNYYVTRLSELMVNGDRMQVLIVYRNITNHRRYNLTMTLALTRAGQIIYLFWSNSKCFLHVDQSIKLNTRRVIYGEPGVYRNWHKDVQLYSKYLDIVDREKLFKRSYKYQREDLRRILGDFIEYLLLLKPEDVVCFAIHYFTAFGHGLLRECPSMTYQESIFKDFYGEFGERTEEVGSTKTMEEMGEMFNLWLGEAYYYQP